MRGAPEAPYCVEMARASSGLLRPVAALAAGALALHELRYRLADPGHGDPASLVVPGHAYLPVAQALALLLLVLAAAAGLRAAARGHGLTASAGGPLGQWLRASAALGAVHVGQEWVERLLAAGRPPSWEAVLGSGGWVALPLALGLGALVAVLLRGADRAAGAARGRPRAVLRAPEPLALAAATPPAADRPAPRTLRPGAAGRAPPLSAA